VRACLAIGLRGMTPLAGAGPRDGRNSGRHTIDGLVVRHHGKRLVEVVQQFLPLLVLGRLSKANFMIFERLPDNEQEVFVGPLDAPLQIM
jgi:hypothetical protein